MSSPDLPHPGYVEQCAAGPSWPARGGLGVGFKLHAAPQQQCEVRDVSALIGGDTGSVRDLALRDALCLCKPEPWCFLLASFILIPTGNAPNWQKVPYNTERFTFSYISVYDFTSHHPPRTSAPSHHFATGKFPPRVVARTSASSPRKAASAFLQLRASPLRRRRVGRGVEWKGGEDERDWLNGDERAPRCH